MASVAPVIKAKPEDLLPALSIVFILNALAVIFFPLLGNWIGPVSYTHLTLPTTPYV